MLPDQKRNNHKNKVFIDDAIYKSVSSLFIYSDKVMVLIKIVA